MRLFFLQKYYREYKEGIMKLKKLVSVCLMAMFITGCTPLSAFAQEQEAYLSSGNDKTVSAGCNNSK